MMSIEEFHEMPSLACEDCPFWRKSGCEVPYKVCWKRPVQGTDFTVRDVVTAALDWLAEAWKGPEEE
jgi:hypothetical protein